MVSRKDAAEAHTFSRRRLVTAFVSGAPAGREVEPPGTARSVAAGAALTVLVLAGAAIAGYVSGRPESGWLSDGSFVVAKETGQQYVVLDDGPGGDAQLHRVPNFVSAQLLTGRTRPVSHTVARKHLADVRMGRPLGIPTASASLPSSAELLETPWSACTADGRGVEFSVHPTDEAPAPDAAFVLTSDGTDRWLVAVGGTGQAMRYELEQGVNGWLPDQLDFPARSAILVSPAFLALFEQGTPLTAKGFEVEGAGSPVSYGNLAGHKVGDLVRTPTDDHFLLSAAGPRKIDAFAAQLYSVMVAAPTDLGASPTVQAERAGTPREWPTRIPTVGNDRNGEAVVCAVLTPDGDAPSMTVTVGSGATPAEGVDLRVPPERGVHVRVRPTEESQQPRQVVVDDLGVAHSVPDQGVAALLGYGSRPAPLVPAEWTVFFGQGPELSREAARGEAPAGG